MTRRRWLLAVLALVAAGALAAGVVLSTQQAHGKLVYSVTASGKGRLKAMLRDSREGDHTTWLVLHDAPEGGDRLLLDLFSRGDAADVQWVGSSKRLRLPAGVYRYGVYSTDHLYAPDDPRYWTAPFRFAEGDVTVL